MKNVLFTMNARERLYRERLLVYGRSWLFTVVHGLSRSFTIIYGCSRSFTVDYRKNKKISRRTSRSQLFIVVCSRLWFFTVVCECSQSHRRTCTEWTHGTRLTSHLRLFFFSFGAPAFFCGFFTCLWHVDTLAERRGRAMGAARRS